MSRNDLDFVALLHHILVRERRRSMREVADVLGMSYAALHARVIGRVPFSPGEINALLREVADIRLVDALLRHTRFSALERPQPGGSSAGAGAQGAALHAMKEIVDALRDMIPEGSSAGLDTETIERIDTHLNEAQRALATLRLALVQLGRTTARSQERQIQETVTAARG
jgi:hypothetical protein